MENISSSLPKLSSAFSYQNWPTNLAILVISLVALFIKVTWQPSFPKGTPKLVPELPILGALRLYKERLTFFREAMKSSPTGHFSTYVGKYQVIGVSGHEARKTYFDSRELDMTEGYSVLYAAAPAEATPMDDIMETGGFKEHNSFFSKTITTLLKKENFVRNLSLLTSDTATSLQRLVEREGAQEGIFNPFDDIYRIVYQLTMRTVGATEIANSPEMLAKTLSLFEAIERSASATRIIFPWLPTLGYLSQMYNGAKLYSIFNKINNDRLKTGRREEDAFQFLMDSNIGTVRVLAFVLGALFAGQLNSSINAAWFFIYLSTNKEWYHRVRDEVDASLARHRTSPSQTVAEIFATLTVDHWEAEFPSIDLALRESIRFQTVGTSFRRNVSNRDVVIDRASGEIIPPRAFAMYLVDDAHMNPDIFSNPEKFDPGRYERGEDKKAPNSYLGWGAGRHPCLGMRFAKLEMMIIGAIFVAMFDYEAVDGKGNILTEQPVTDRQRHSAHKPTFDLRLKYTVRKH